MSEKTTTYADTEEKALARACGESFADCLSTGIKIHCAHFFNEEKRLLKEIKHTEGKLAVYKNQLVKLKEKRIKKDRVEEEIKKFEERRCTGCRTESDKKLRVMKDGRKLCRNCFMST